MMNMKFTVTQTAAAMGIEDSQLNAILTANGILPQDGGLTLEQIQRLQQIQEQQRMAALRAQNALERAVQKHTLLIDTCALLHEQFPLLAKRLEPLLRQNCRALVVPSSVVAELRFLPLKKPELAERVQALMPLLSQLQKQGLLRVYGDQGETFGDRQMLAAVTTLLTTSSLLVITQDRNLSNDVLLLNQLDCMRDKQAVAVSRVNQYGYLSRFQPQCPGQTEAAEKQQKPMAAEDHAPETAETGSRGASGPVSSWISLWSSFAHSFKEELAAQRAAQAREREAARKDQPAGCAAQGPQSGEHTHRAAPAAGAESAEVVRRVSCVDCSKTFEITRGEYLYFQQHDLVLPRRCPACRRLRKLRQTGMAFSA